LKEINFTVYNIEDFINLRWFTPQLTPTPADKLKINLTFGKQSDFEELEELFNYSRLSQYEIECTKEILTSLLSLKSQVRVHVKQMSILCNLKRTLAHEIHSYEDFCSLINSFDLEHSECVVGPSLKDHFKSLETFVYGKHGIVNQISFPSSLQSLTLIKGFPPKTLPESLKILNLEDWTCSLNLFQNSLAYLEN